MLLNVMTSSLQHGGSGTPVALPRIQEGSEDGSSERQVTVKEKITKEIISTKESLNSDSEAPFLPKVRGGLHLQLASAWQPRERTQRKV